MSSQYNNSSQSTSTIFNNNDYLNLPPTPLTSFIQAQKYLEKYRNTHRIDGMIIAGYDDQSQFIDPHHHTRFDNASYVSLENILRAGRLLSQSLFIAAGGSVDKLATPNETLAEELFDCLLKSWNCKLFNEFLPWEIKSLKKTHPLSILTGLGAEDIDNNEKSFPPNYFVGAYSCGINGGQPCVIHDGEVFARYSGSWDAGIDSISLSPNKLEAFLHSILSYLLGIPPPTSSLDVMESCEMPSDCYDSVHCRILNHENVLPECIRSICLCPTAFYHNALDPGLTPDETPGLFSIIDKDAPIFTQPYWNTLGLTVKKKTSFTVEIITLILGITIFLCTYFTIKKGKERIFV